MKRVVDVLIGDMIGNSLKMEVRVEIYSDGQSTISKITEHDDPVDVEIYDNWIFILSEAIHVLEGINFGSDGSGRNKAVEFLRDYRQETRSPKDIMILM